MKVLCFSDVHGKADIIETFVKDVKKRNLDFDVIIAAGDINNPQRPRVFIDIMESLTSLGKPVLYVKGNWDVNLPERVVPGAVDLEESGPFRIKGYTIVGHGRVMRRFPVKDDEKIILVTHYPPFSIMDKGKKLEAPQQTLHSGLIEINYLIAEYRPIVHIFGHSHTYGGIDWKIGNILYVNVARLDRVAKNGDHIGNYCLITLNGDNVKIEWFFLNGTLRVCSNCGKKVYLPPGWTLCRKCANRRDLRFERLPHEFANVKVKVSGWGGRSLFLNDCIHVPLDTIANKEAYNDFLERVVLSRLIKELERVHDKVVVLSKDKVIEYYGNRYDGYVVPFSELLFSCDSRIMGPRLCALMRLYSKDKRVHVLWGVRRSKKAVIEAEYVLFEENIASVKEDIESIRELGFIPLVLQKKIEA